ncbi:MAG: endo-1,4-beta-xylanase [Ignavibacteriales bacterium]|nr:endo-1,4-beta-xylanase [Ignavibacteriales bacterium]
MASEGELVFRPYFVQSGVGPHLLDWAYASDANWDAFHSDITAGRDGVRISDTEGRERFAIDVRWNVEGFGYIFITADNGGEYYRLPGPGKTETRNLNYELANSRVARNRRRFGLHRKEGWKPSREVEQLVALSDGYLSDAAKQQANPERCAELSQKSLLYAMVVAEKIELEKAELDIARNGSRPDFFVGCDARGYFQMDVEKFLDLFPQLFNYATITHYLVSGVFEDFEAEEGKKRFELRTALFNELRRRNIAVEGRPLWWSYKTTTPDWLRRKNFDQIKIYLEDHVRKVVGHYGEGMYAWEIVNEFHDWANECQLTPDQAVELTKLACDVARDTAPKVHRLINNCCPFAEYVQLKKWTDLDALYPQRTPWQFMKDLTDAGVDYTITGQQMYFPYRDLADTIILIERLETFGRPVQLTEVGASSGPSADSIHSGRLTISNEPYIWHRPWDEELQADWMEWMYTLAYSKPFIEAINWYDFVDPHSWIPNGGFLRSPKGEKRAVFDRLLKLQERWKSLPRKQ